MALTRTSSDLSEFAPAPRQPMDVVHGQFRAFVGTHCRAFFDTLPNMIMTLNSHRQVVFANKAIVTFLGHSDVEELLGRRPGEALGCVNASVGVGGCGTSRHCRSCGAVVAIMSAISGSIASEDCKLLRRITTDVEGLDLHVNASPILIDEERFIIFSITDITHESRRRSMERIFFHDVLNLAGGIRGLTEMLGQIVPDSVKGEFSILLNATESLVEEVLSQRDLVAAETNELTVIVKTVDTQDILRKLRGFYEHSPVAHGRIIALDQTSIGVGINTDARLVLRVLGNMLKNALETLPLGGTALASCREEGEQVVFSVHNPGLIPQHLQDNIFRRTFSTKGSGRGMGTYSMLLLAERYLGGSVGFRSTELDGTVFFLRLPKESPAGQCAEAPITG